MSEQLTVTLLLASMIFGFISILSVGVLVFFRGAIMKDLKLKRLIRLGFIIARLKRIDRTEKEIVVKPKKENNGVVFPGVEGTYLLDDASVILKDRKFPVYEWREGEVTPINTDLEYMKTKVTCPHCEVETTVNVKMPKSLAPAILDNLILKIKTLALQMSAEDIKKLLIVGGIILIGGLGLVAFLIYNLQNNLPDIVRPVISSAVKSAMQRNATIIIP